MSFGGTQGGEGALVVVSRVAVHRCEPPDQQPHTSEDEFEVEIWEAMPNRRHVLVMSRALLEDFVKKAQAALDDQG